MSQQYQPSGGIHHLSERSYQNTLERFSTERVAKKYPANYRNTRRDRREIRAILNSLRGIPRNAHVLDIPCGSGRLLQLLLDGGYRVTCADSSANMVQLAQSRWREISGTSGTAHFEPRFYLSDVMQTGFAEDEFDAVICNRLFHHFATSDTRVQALTELCRICKGPIAVSFFNSFAVDAVRWHVRNNVRRLLGRKTRTDRRPISMAVFRDDIRRAGLEVVRSVAVLYGVSPMWYVVAARAKSANAARAFL